MNNNYVLFLNLAVVCDADQIIHASIHKSEGNRIEYTTGAIEGKKINGLLVDVLEGSRRVRHRSLPSLQRIALAGQPGGGKLCTTTNT